MTLPSVQCPHSQRCGGCALIGLPYSVQLDHKRDAVVRALSPYVELRHVEPAPPIAAPSIEMYRVRAKLVASGQFLGLYEKGSHVVVDVPGCRVLRPRVSRSVDAVRQALPFQFTLLAVDVREADAGTLVTLIVSEETRASEVRAAAELLIASCPEILGVSWSRRARQAPTLLGSVPISLVGPPSVPHRLEPEGPYHRAVPGSFVQAHAGQAARLHAALEQSLESSLGTIRGQRIIDLFAGSGAFALRLASRGAIVTAVDSFAVGLQELKRAAREQNLQLKVVPVSAEQALHTLEPADAILVNPPRRGLSVRTRKLLSALKPKLVLYVSCEPARLARDLGHLAQLGLRTRGVLPLDMIPLTDAVEVLADLVPEAPPEPRILHQDEAWVVVDKPPHLPLRLGSEPSLSARVRLLGGLEQAAPLQVLEDGVSGACLLARQPGDGANDSAAPPGARFTFLALVSGVTHEKGSLRMRRKKADTKLQVARYRRERVVGTHSLLSIVTDDPAPSWIQQRLAELRHPVLGDERNGNGAANRYFEARYGLDRAFLHCTAIEFDSATVSFRVTSELSPDLSVVLEQLERARPDRAMRS